MNKIGKFMLCALMLIIVFFGSCKEGQKTVKIAAIFPISGPNASFGVGMMNSAKMAVDIINKSGKLDDIKLELLELDDESKPEKARNVTTRAANDRDVAAVIAHWNSGCALATNSIFHRYKLANIVPGAVNNQITLGNDYKEILRIIPHDITQNMYAAQYAVKILGKKKIFLVNDNTTYGRSLTGLFRKFAVENGAEIIGEDSINVGERDYSTILTKIKSYEPDHLFFGGVVTEAALIRKQMIELKFDIPFQSGTGIISNAFIDVARDAAENSISTHFAPPVDFLPGGTFFVEQYQKAGFKDPHESYGPHAYAAIEVIAEAIRRVGPDRQKIIDELNTGEFDTILGKVSFDEDGQTRLITMGIYEVHGSQWKLMFFTDSEGVLKKQF